MGQTQSTSDWQEQYYSLSNPIANPKLLKHKTNDQKYELLSLPISSEQQENYLRRLNLRHQSNKSKFLTPMVKYRQKKERAVCGGKEQLELIFGQISPNLDELLRYRRVANIIFSEEEILYIIHNVAYGLKDTQNIKEEHGRVDLTSITITHDVYLKDPLLLQEEEKLEPSRKSQKDINGFPSPQKLKSFYDSFTGFEELRGDLFSLGIVALQLYHSKIDIKDIYTNPDPRFRNYSINFQKLGEKIQNISFHKLKNAVEILTNFESKKRLQIYELLRGVSFDPSRLPMLKESVVYIQDNRSIELPRIKPKDQSPVRYSEPVNRDRNIQPELRSTIFEDRNVNRIAPVTEQQIFTKNVQYQPQQPKERTFHINMPKYEPIYISPSVNFNHSSKPEVTTSQMISPSSILSSDRFNSIFATNVLSSLKKDSSYLPDSNEENIGVTYNPSLQKNTQFTYVSTLKNDDYDHRKYQNSFEVFSTTKLPTFQEILNKVKSNDPNSLLNRLPSSAPSRTSSPAESNIPPMTTYGELPKIETNTGVLKRPLQVTGPTIEKNKFMTFSTFQKMYKLEATQSAKSTSHPQETYVPRSAIIQGSESIYQQEKKQQTKMEKQSGQQENLQEFDPDRKVAEENQRREKDIDISQAETRIVQTQDINQATSTVSAIPQESEHEDRSSVRNASTDQNEAYQLEESSDSIRVEPPQPSSPISPKIAEQLKMFPDPESNSKNVESHTSYRSIGSLRSDPKIVVMQPLEIEPSFPIKEDGSVFVTEEYEVGTKYEGYMVDNKRHGKGKFYYKEGSYYDGEWRYNKMHGFGTLYYPDGLIAYQGEWKEDEFDGKGKVFNDQQRPIDGQFDYTDFNQLDDEWVKYEGDLKNDAKQGYGRLYLTNGDIYEGQFFRDMVHGVGVFKSDKSEKRGIWQQGKLKKLL